MVTVKEAYSKVHKKFPDYDVYMCLEYPDSYAFSMGPKERPLWWVDCWVCIDKSSGNEIEGRSFSSIDSFKNSKIVEL